MRRKIPGFSGHLATVLGLVTVAVAIVVGLIYLGGGMPRVGETYRVRALVPTAATLATGSRVTMSGAAVGTVKKVERQGLGAVIDMEITDASVFPIPADSKVKLRQHTPVGENYVSIDPGDADTMLEDGAMLPIDRAGDFVDVDTVLSTLSGKTQARARQLLRSTGAALDHRGERLNELLGNATGTINPFADVIRVVNRDREQVSRLVQQLGNLTAAVGERDEAIETIGRQGLASVRAIGDRDAELRKLLAVLPGTLSQVRETSGTVARVTDRATPVLANLGTAVREVRPAVRRLRPAAQEGRGLVRILGQAAPPLQRTLANVRTLSGPARAAFPQLRRTLCQLNPMVRYLKPYTNDIVSAVGALGSSANSYDAIGHVIRLTPIVNEEELTGLPKPVADAAYELIRAGILSEALPLNYDPYPEPNRIGKPGKRLNDRIKGPAELARSGYQYPRVTADC
ncbi:MAG: Virulence factor Mce family protein [Solirubrobacterales bacterium]|nr:Virulence factor Mce family protein [Solirubrobacterales bacterium]